MGRASFPYPCHHMGDKGVGASYPTFMPSGSHGPHSCQQSALSFCLCKVLVPSVSSAVTSEVLDQFSPVLQPVRGRSNTVQPWVIKGVKDIYTAEAEPQPQTWPLAATQVWISPVQDDKQSTDLNPHVIASTLCGCLSPQDITILSPPFSVSLFFTLPR